MAGLLAALVVVAVGGSLLGSQLAVPRALPSTVVGRSSTVCTLPGNDADGSESPSPTPSGGSGGDGAPTQVSVVAVRGDAAGEGSLTGSVLPAGAADLSVTEPGSGHQPAEAPGPVLLTGQGAMATTGSGVVSSSATSGEFTGLMGAPCLPPGTEQWLVGVGSTDADRTELILTNPDEAQAEVDLRFYGPRGRVVVPGSPGVVVAGRSTRTVSVSSLVDTSGPLSVAARASAGRVTVAARRVRTVDLQPGGADWQVPSSTPATTVVIPGVPGDGGTRSLAVVNPGSHRAQVGVEVLG